MLELWVILGCVIALIGLIYLAMTDNHDNHHIYHAHREGEPYDNSY